jgi:hypothetical protein
MFFGLGQHDAKSCAVVELGFVPQSPSLLLDYSGGDRKP